MRHQYVEEGFTYRLRPMRVSDAAFTLGLRLDPKNRPFIHATSPRLDDQVHWIVSRLDCPTDFSFVLEDRVASTPVGSASIYEHDPTKRKARYGRWLTSSRLCAVEFIWLGYRVIFERLDLDRIFARIPEKNKAAIGFQRRMGARRVVSSRPDYSELEGGREELYEFEVTRDMWPSINDMLRESAERAFQRARGPAQESASSASHTPT